MLRKYTCAACNKRTNYNHAWVVIVNGREYVTCSESCAHLIRQIG